jgi:hypothetical protein
VPDQQYLSTDPNAGTPVPAQSGAAGRFIDNAVEPYTHTPEFLQQLIASLLPTEGGKAARTQIGQALVNPSVDQLTAASKAHAEGRPLDALGHLAGAFPVVGPAIAAGVDQVRSGDAAGGSGKIAGVMAPFVAGPIVRGAGALVRESPIGEVAADVADRASTRQLADTMTPKTGANKPRFAGMAKDVAPSIARDPALGALSRGGLQAGVEARLGEAEALLDQAADARGTTKSYPTKPLLQALEAKKRALVAEAIDASEPTPETVARPAAGGLVDAQGKPLTVSETRAVPIGSDVVPDPNKTRVAQIDKAIAEVKALGPLARYDALRRIRAAYDEPAKAVYSPAVTTDYMAKMGDKRGAADVTGAIREQLAKFEPDSAAANATYALYKRASEVLQAAEEADAVRPNRGRGIVARAVGATIGASSGGAAGAGLGATIAGIADRAAEGAPTFQIAIARRLAAIADALRKGDTSTAQTVLQGTVQRLPRVKSALKVSLKALPGAAESALPLAADSGKDRQE